VRPAVFGRPPETFLRNTVLNNSIGGRLKVTLVPKVGMMFVVYEDDTIFVSESFDDLQ
jgi:hypothetical protein